VPEIEHRCRLGSIDDPLELHFHRVRLFQLGPKETRFEGVNFAGFAAARSITCRNSFLNSSPNRVETWSYRWSASATSFSTAG
jgi:hypothetical protein